VHYGETKISIDIFGGTFVVVVDEIYYTFVFVNSLLRRRTRQVFGVRRSAAINAKRRAIIIIIIHSCTIKCACDVIDGGSFDVLYNYTAGEADCLHSANGYTRAGLKRIFFFFFPPRTRTLYFAFVYSVFRSTHP